MAALPPITGWRIAGGAVCAGPGAHFSAV